MMHQPPAYKTTHQRINICQRVMHEPRPHEHVPRAAPDRHERDVSHVGDAPRLKPLAIAVPAVVHPVAFNVDVVPRQEPVGEEDGGAVGGGKRDDQSDQAGLEVGLEEDALGDHAALQRGTKGFHAWDRGTACQQHNLISTFNS